MLRFTAASLALLSLLGGCTGSPSSAASFTFTVNDGGDPARAWVISDQGVPDRPAWDGDWSAWAVSAGATPLSALTILLTVQGQAVVKAVRVKVVAQRPPLAGTQYVVVGGDPVTHERIEVDLDKSLETLQVRAADGDTIAVTVQTQQCDCDFAIELDWQGGTRTVDNNGKPFRVSASTATVGRCVTYPDRVEKCETF